MPTETEPEVKPDLSPDEPREFGTPLEEIFKKSMPYEEEIEEAKAAKEPPKPVEAPIKPAKESEPPKDIKTPELPQSVFSDTPELPKAEEGEPVKAEPPPELKGKARENFQKLADSKYEVDKKARDLEGKLKKAEERLTQGDPDAKQRVAELEKQLAQYSERITMADARLHPVFQANYVVPRAQLLERAKAAFKDSGGDPQELESAVGLTGKARMDKLDELYQGVTNTFLRNRLERTIDEIDNKDAEANQVLRNSAEWLKQVQQYDAVNRHKALEEHEKATKHNLDLAKTVLRDEHKFEIYKQVDDPKFKWWNDQIESMDKAAEHIMLKIDDPKELAIAARLAVTAVPYRTMFLKEREARIKAEKQLSEYKDIEPGLGGGGKSAADKTGEEDEGMSMSEAIIAGLKKGRFS